MVTLSGTDDHYNDLKMTEYMRARVDSQFYGRNISYKTIFYVLEILGQFVDKENLVMYL